jgi:TRAP-type C4-dicarboxylate transport system permease small subunit
MILLLVFSLIVVAYAFKSVQKFWAARIGAKLDSVHISGGSDSDPGRAKVIHRTSALWSITVSALNLPWVAYLAYVTRENEYVSLPVMVVMGVYVIVLNAVAKLGFKLIEDRY